MGSPQVTPYDLVNSGVWLKDACALPATRTWLENAIGYAEDVHMVVGLCALEGTSGKQIFAVQYRKVRSKCPSSQEINNMSSGTNTRLVLPGLTDYRWYGGCGDGDDIVEANLIHTSGLGILNEGYTGEDGVYCLRGRPVEQFYEIFESAVRQKSQGNRGGTLK